MRKKYLFHVIMMTLVVMAAPSCHNSQNNGKADDSATALQSDDNKDASDNTLLVAEDDIPVAVNLDAVSLSDDGTELAKAESEVSKKTPATTKAAYSKKETIYISTYGANGKVWGHVTMNGNSGRGTIHDDDENSYSITVTRHGSELYGTDQNGRQYVFRL